MLALFSCSKSDSENSVQAGQDGVVDWRALSWLAHSHCSTMNWHCCITKIGF